MMPSLHHHHQHYDRHCHPNDPSPATSRHDLPLLSPHQGVPPFDVLALQPVVHRAGGTGRLKLPRAPSNGAAAGEMELPEKSKLQFTNYNLFFKLEHAYVSGETHEGRRPSSVGEGRTGKYLIAAIQPRDPSYFHDPDIPTRYCI
jgi:hypothetical protein